MAQYIHSTKVILALLIVAAAVTVGAGVPGLAHAATEKAPGLVQAGEKANETLQQVDNEKHRRRIRQENDKQLKMQEPLYPRQAGSLAKRYKETAAIVTRQGGDPKPLLDAAAYFERQSE